MIFQKQASDSLTDSKQSRNEEDRILDVLSQGLAAEFPNPERVGCPGSAILEGIASHKIHLAEAEKWLDHLGSCSPCFQEFATIRGKLRKRRVLGLGGGLAIVLAAISLWLVLHPQSVNVQDEVATLDLRVYSAERGQPDSSNRPPLVIPHAVKHLILYLPIGSKEGTYELALLKEPGGELVRTTGVARLENHVVMMRTNVDVSGVPPGSYFLGLRPGLEWTRFPVRVR